MSSLTITRYNCKTKSFLQSFNGEESEENTVQNSTLLTQLISLKDVCQQR
jgi:hypothetical protein